jgi:lysophospholipid acyltransferase (LPLAT)-like uncharacterized protein
VRIVGVRNRQTLPATKLKIEEKLARWLIAFGVRLLDVWERTLHYEVDDRAGILGKSVTENYIGALWHNRLLIFPLILRRFFSNRRGAALISASRDGDLLTDAIRRFGYDVIRGSSSRLGASAMLRLTQELASGSDVVITPDGPRGPAYKVGPGIVFLAQKSGAPVLPMNLEYSRCWRLGTWDRFVIPQPFSKVRVLIGQPHHVCPTGSPDGFEAERLRVQEAMMSLVEMR